MINGPFEALQNIYLFDPMTGKPLPNANPVLLKLAQRKNRVEDRLEHIKNLDLNNVKIEPIHWKKCINISGPDLDQEMAFDMLAQKLEYDNKWPLELCKLEKDGMITFYIRTGI